MMRMRCRADRVDGDLHVAVGAVLEAHRARQAGRQLAMHLALGGARADRAPAHQVGDVLRGDHVEKLAAGRHAQLVDADQQAARQAQAAVDAEAAVQVRIVDQPLPADRGARLLEVHAHHDFQRVGVLLALGGESLGVLDGGAGVVDRARADHHGEAVVAALQDGVEFLAGAADRAMRRIGGGAVADHLGGRAQALQFADAQVVGGRIHGGASGFGVHCRRASGGLAAFRIRWDRCVAYDRAPGSACGFG
jgi:hypothetical protein